MTLKIDSSLSKYSAQSLVLLFFPGSSFPEDGSGGEPVVELSAKVDSNGKVLGRAKISENGRTVEKVYSPSASSEKRVSQKMLLNLAAGGAMYLAGSEFCGTRPPWGTVTGVRPAKMCRDMIEKGISADEAARRLMEDFHCSEQKAYMAAGVGEREIEFINERTRRECSVYIAIPFCPTRCSYCSFVSFSSPRLLSMIPQYLQRLFVDIKNTFEIIKELGLRVSCVYIGGGTPTTLDANGISALLDTVTRYVDPSSLDEFTLEAGRPDTIDAEKLRIAKKYGVGRVSVNAQTMNADILSAIGRRHTPEDFLRAFSVAAESGIRDINVDLIAGLPGESADSFAASCEKIISLDPTNITVHTFYVKRAAEILKKNANVYRAEDIIASEAVNRAHSALSSAGYLPYYLYKQKNTAANLENAGFSKKGHEGLYNIFMMEEVHSVFGIGASAMTKLVSPIPDNMKIQRLCETKYPYEYLDPEKSSAGERYEKLRAACLDFYGRYK